MVHISYLTNIYGEQKILAFGEESYSKYKQKCILKKKMDTNILKMHVLVLSQNTIFFSPS